MDILSASLKSMKYSTWPCSYAQIQGFLFVVDFHEQSRSNVLQLLAGAGPHHTNMPSQVKQHFIAGTYPARPITQCRCCSCILWPFRNGLVPVCRAIRLWQEISLTCAEKRLICIPQRARFWSFTICSWANMDVMSLFDLGCCIGWKSLSTPPPHHICYSHFQVIQAFKYCEYSTF